MIFNHTLGSEILLGTFLELARYRTGILHWRHQMFRAVRTVISCCMDFIQMLPFLLTYFNHDISWYVHDSNAIIIPNTGTSLDYSPLVGNIIPRMGTSIPMILHDYPNSCSINSNCASIVWYDCNVMWVEINGICIHFRKMGKKIDFR